MNATNFAQAAAILSTVDSNNEVLCAGLDADAKHFYGTSSIAQGEYVGTRFSDGSAVSASGHTRQLVEFLGTFAGEQA